MELALDSRIRCALVLFCNSLFMASGKKRLEASPPPHRLTRPHVLLGLRHLTDAVHLLHCPDGTDEDEAEHEATCIGDLTNPCRWLPHDPNHPLAFREARPRTHSQRFVPRPSTPQPPTPPSSRPRGRATSPTWPRQRSPRLRGSMTWWSSGPGPEERYCPYPCHTPITPIPIPIPIPTRTGY